MSEEFDFSGHVHGRPIPQVLSLFERRLKDQGGKVEDTTCRGTELPRVDAVGVVYTQGCGGHTRISFTYEGEDDDIHSVTLCAICDSAFIYPRFMQEV